MDDVAGEGATGLERAEGRHHRAIRGNKEGYIYIRAPRSH